ncbi:MAG: hypothetical protein JSV92_04430 [archaeon]|nr:MAG: hypothetical protein JSV92_04430 [archaeon]
MYKNHKNKPKTFKCKILNKNINFNKTCEGPHFIIEVHSIIKFDDNGNPEGMMCTDYMETSEDGTKNYCEILKGRCHFSGWKKIYNL